MLLDTKLDNPNHHLVIGIHRALMSSPRVVACEKVDYSNAIPRAQAGRFDLLLAVDGEGVNVDVISRIKPLVGLSCLWAWEDPYEHDVLQALAPLFDVVLTNDAGSVDGYERGATHLPLAAESFLPVRTADADYEYDVSFIGTAWPNRVTLIQVLLAQFPELRFRVNLSYNPDIPQVLLDLPPSSYIRAVSNRDYLDVCNRSRVNLSLGRSFSGDGVRRISRTPGPRVFETALVGGYQLVEAEGLDLGHIYEVGSEIDVFDNLATCVDLVRAALNDPDQRIEKAVRAQVRSLREHTWARRLETVFDIADERFPGLCGPRSKRSGKARLLFVTHNTMATGNFGGVEVYQETVAAHLRDAYEIYYFRPDSSPEVTPLVFALTDMDHQVMQRFSVEGFHTSHVLTNSASETVFAQVLEDLRIDLVHFHHLMRHAPSLPLVSQMLGVPAVFTLQDFWSVCTRFNLIDQDGNYCRIADRPIEVCDVCLQRADLHQPGSQAYRRSFFRQVLQSFDRILGNSPSSVEICRAIYPDLPADRFVTIGLPTPVPSESRAPLRSRTGRSGAGDGPLRVVVLGNFSTNKGAQTVLDVARLLDGEEIEIVVCGRVDPPYPEMIRRLGLPNLRVEGVFAPGSLDLSGFDISLHLSIWPETYCIALSEAWQAGLVPIVSDCGALADRVHDGRNGFKTPIDGAGEVASLLRRLAADRDLLERTRRNIRPSLWRSPRQHCDALDEVYRELIAARPQLSRARTPVAATGAPTTLALTGRAPLSSDFAHPDRVSATGPGGSPDALAVAWRDYAKVRGWLREGRTTRLGTVRGSVDPGDPATRTAAVPVPVHFTGWVETSAGAAPALKAGLRSLGGELAPLHLVLRRRTTGQAAGPAVFDFSAGPVTPELLADGVYGLEIYGAADGHVPIAPLPCALAVRRGSAARLDAPPGGCVSALFAGPLRPDLPESPAPCLTGFIDHIRVVRALAGRGRTGRLLQVSGWLVERPPQGAAAPIALRLRCGDAEWFAWLEPQDRPDVRESLHLPSAALACGYRGGVWLGDLPEGRYCVEAVKIVRGFKCAEALTILDIGSKDRAAKLERFASASGTEAAR